MSFTQLGAGPPVLSFDVGGTDTKAALIDSDGVILGLSRTPTALSPNGDTAESVIRRVGALAAELVAEFPAITPRAAGIIVPGIVDDVAGVGVLSTNLGWRDVPFRDLLSARLGMPVVFTHDVRAAGAAEHRLGAARPFDHVAVLVIGTGIAGAILIDGRPHVSGGYAGEVGHAVVFPDGPPCGCGGRGHLEAISSAGAIAHRYAQASGRVIDGAREVVRRAQEDDALAQQVWHEAIDALALHLSQLVAVLAPEAIVIGGGLSQAGDALFSPLRERLDGYLTFQRRPALLPAEIGENAGLIGAALLARELLTSDPLPRNRLK